MTKTIIISIVCLAYYVLGQEVEYYPSNAALKKLRHSEDVLKPLWDDKNGPSYMRHFLKDSSNNKKTKRAVDPVFHGHSKTREELWNERFLQSGTKVFDQNFSLIKLLHNITLTYLDQCTPVILYDSQVKTKESFLFQDLLKDFPVTYIHGYINDKNHLEQPSLLHPVLNQCLNFIVFLTDVTLSAKILGKQPYSKVVIVARSSQWAVHEFLAGPQSRNLVNLLVIAQSINDKEDKTLESPYILYTHMLYVDGLGASAPIVLNSWSQGKYSRSVDLFPLKMRTGYAGHRFVVAAAHQPPFVFRIVRTDADGGNPRVTWDGIEIRLLKLLASRNNFSIEVKEPRELYLGPGDAVAKEIAMTRADIGISGIYLTSDRIREMDVTTAHSHDCATFVTLMSTALPRYRAILGPFHWHVWVALTFTYLIGIFPLAFSDKHSLRHLINDSGEIENMFWYVFGTFTNCFTFVGKNSWSKTTKITTRLLIGWYWVFTIIITSCYTGSIIAFVTLPIFPETVDTIDQLLGGFYRLGTLDRGGWERWFFNSSDPQTNKLLKKMEFVPNVAAGIRNTTKAFFFPYAFLGSRAQLEYIVQSNFSKTESKRAMLHVSDECLVPFGVTIGFPSNSIYTAKLSGDIQRMHQSGLLQKITNEVNWVMHKIATGKFLAASSGSIKITSAEEKGLTLEDTQGMFLLLGAGFLMALTALLSEWMGGFTKKCRLPKKSKVKPSSANSREHLIATPISRDQTEIDVCNHEFDSRVHLHSRTPSDDTLDGQIISLTEDAIIVHKNFDVDVFESRRSSSVDIDIDKEIREIFEKDFQRRRIQSDGEINKSEKRRLSPSQGAFGDCLSNTT